MGILVNSRENCYEKNWRKRRDNGSIREGEDAELQ